MLFKNTIYGIMNSIPPQHIGEVNRRNKKNIGDGIGIAHPLVTTVLSAYARQDKISTVEEICVMTRKDHGG
jgi:hypothetical protein